MSSRVVRAAVSVCCLIAVVTLVALSARAPAYAEPELPTLPPIFRVGTSVIGVTASGARESLTILETRGKWVRAQTEGGPIVWLAPETWTRWVDPASPSDTAGTKALSQMAEFGASIDLWKRARRTLPNSLEDLTQRDPGTGETYIESGKIPLDPWGKAYEYRVLDEKRLRYVITSSGPDCLKDTDDDVYYPERPPR